MTSYMTMVSGPTPAMVKKDGKWVEEEKEMHIILLDNGRLRAAKDEKFKEIFQCVRCASCLNVCPVYTLIGGHVYGHIYAGGIGAILTAFLHGMKEFEQFHELCIGCRRCTTVCPGKIDIPGLIEELRIRKVKEKGLPFLLKQAFENVISNRKLFHSLLQARRDRPEALPGGKADPPPAALPRGAGQGPEPPGDRRRAAPRPDRERSRRRSRSRRRRSPSSAAARSISSSPRRGSRSSRSSRI